MLKEIISFLGVKFTEVSNVKKAESYLTSYFDIMSIEVFSLKLKDLAISTSANLLHYIDELQKGNDLPFSKIEYKNIDNIMELNISTQNNLNLVPKRNE